MKDEEQLMSLTELTEWMAERGVRRSKQEWYRRARDGQFGRKVGSQWVVTNSEAQSLLESFTAKGS